ncbi:putative riboflavin synthase [Kockovaella imperatae]|uniref:Riboflavin synthase n=1 Tax=Kockovaella imperatae TaxID=4999 RepID=A0A1Y1U7T8_9TREE|nr:putative riboflavin synthase [Kockovaella imperatae]ORX34099.1 putative riboflavin synthase [Kockovaella imperatae]
MFTGIIEHMARVAQIEPTTDSSGYYITFDEAEPILSDCHDGDSICVNGCCLTVTEFTKDSFRVNVANESLSRTNLGDLRVGDRANTERAMSGHTRFGGHMVQGHVDATATITSKVPDGDSIRYTFTFSPTSSSAASTSATSRAQTLMPYLVEKGYITIDGASLTLTEVDDETASFGIMLIAYSQTKLVLTKKQVGDKVNIEVDCVGKYVLGSQARIEGMVERILEKKLKERGL